MHHGGPADKRRVAVEVLTQTRHYATEPARQRTGWIPLARYVFVPPQRDASGTKPGKYRHYQYTGTTQVQGPAPGDKTEPEWSP